MKTPEIVFLGMLFLSVSNQQKYKIVHYCWFIIQIMIHGRCIKIIEAEHVKICNNRKIARLKLLKTNAAIWFKKNV
jgi:hypothetical protein